MKKFLLMAFFAMVMGTFYSCKSKEEQNYPILYVVNGTSYYAEVYCDNRFVLSANAHENSRGVRLSNTSINFPVYVEVMFFNANGKMVNAYHWSEYYFNWNKNYKMTLTTSASSSRITEF